MIHFAYLKIHYYDIYFIYTANILNIVSMTNYHYFVTNLRIYKSKRLIRTCGVIKGLKFLGGADASYNICGTLDNLIKPAEL